jgi:hypothetical protein
MYLIRAECNIRIDPTGTTFAGASALDDFNTIHTRAGLAASPVVSLDTIIYERRLELAFEGFKIHDVRRLHENVTSFPYNDPHLVMPIPAHEIEANPAIKNQQNEGY